MMAAGKGKRGWQLLAGMLYLLLALAGDVSAQEPAGWIAYRGHDGNIWLVRPDGSEQRQVTADARLERDAGDYINYGGPLWSPDGRWLLFARTAESDSVQETRLQLYDPLAGAARPLGDLPMANGYDWLADSSGVVFARPIPDSYWMQQEGAEVHGLWQVAVPDGVAQELLPPYEGKPLARPQVDPSGRYIGFQAVVYIEGSQPFVVYDRNTGAYLPWQAAAGAYSWAPDGSFLVYDGRVYVEPGPGLTRAHPDGSNPLPLSDSGGALSDEAPRVSPGGGLVAFLRGEPLGGSYTLWLVGSDGSNPRALSPHPVDYGYDWAPDGSGLVIARGEMNAERLYLLRLDGTVEGPLAAGRAPAWQPGTTLPPAAVIPDQEATAAAEGAAEATADGAAALQAIAAAAATSEAAALATAEAAQPSPTALAAVAATRTGDANTGAAAGSGAGSGAETESGDTAAGAEDEPFPLWLLLLFAGALLLILLTLLGLYLVRRRRAATIDEPALVAPAAPPGYRCPYCGAQNRPQARFCARCGQPRR